MVTPTTIALLVMVALFAVYVIVQVRPAARRGGRKTTEAIRAAHGRAREAKTTEARSAALADAGEAAAKAGRYVSAAGSFLRALRANPASPEIVHRTGAALASRPRLLESLLLRRVAAVPAAPPSSRDPAFIALLEELAVVYGHRRDRGRARLVERLLAREQLHDDSAVAAGDARA